MLEVEAHTTCHIANSKVNRGNFVCGTISQFLYFLPYHERKYAQRRPVFYYATINYGPSLFLQQHPSASLLLPVRIVDPK